MDHASDITQLLSLADQGDQTAIERVIPLIYNDLRIMARRQLSSHQRTPTLDTTALVHEAYLHLAGSSSPGWESRNHFLSVCATVMRNLVVDLARSRDAIKRGGGLNRVTLDETMLKIDAQAEEIFAIDEALRHLSEIDPLLTRVVECRFFAGLTETETAQALKLSERTVRRHWTKAKALLQRMLEEELG